MKPIVSIIIPVYNGEKYIDKCMDKVLNQTYSYIEVILVDDGSTDDSGSICDEYAKEDARVKVYHQKNGGASAAKNKGILNARGKYVVFVDIDDEIESNMIADNVILAESSHADLVLYGFWYYDMDNHKLIPNKLKSCFSGDGTEFFHNFLIQTIDSEMINPPWNKMIRRRVLMENKILFDTRCPVYEDITFAMELMCYVNMIVVNNKLYYKYFVRSSGSLITKFFDTYFEAVTLFHGNAMDYCDKYDDNRQQIKKFNNLYVKYVYTHFKQISTQKDLTLQEKYDLIKKIVNNYEFRQTIDRVNLKGRKQLVKYLISRRKYKSIYRVYSLFNIMQKNEVRKNGK
jgi:glycosyltransferase involved in cell wall biosynthesis